jgi:hypothetical protein
MISRDRDAMIKRGGAAIYRRHFGLAQCARANAFLIIAINFSIFAKPIIHFR